MSIRKKKEIYVFDGDSSTNVVCEGYANTAARLRPGGPPERIIPNQ